MGAHSAYIPASCLQLAVSDRKYPLAGSCKCDYFMSVKGQALMPSFASSLLQITQRILSVGGGIALDS